MASLRSVGNLLKSLLQLVQILAQLGKWLLGWIGFLTRLLGGMKSGLCRIIFLVLVSIFGSVCSMCTSIFLSQLARLVKTDFLVSLCGIITGPPGSCLVLVQSFLARCCMGFLVGTYTINSLKRSLKRMHVHGCHTIFLQVVLILPLVRIHPENVTHQISLQQRYIHQLHAGNVA